MEVSDEIPGKDRSWVTLSSSIISPCSLMLAWWSSPNGAISKFGILRELFGRIRMHQPFSTSFAGLVEIIFVCLLDADLWLPFKSRWRKPVMRIFSSMGVV